MKIFSVLSYIAALTFSAEISQNVTIPLGENGTFSCNTSVFTPAIRLNSESNPIDVERTTQFPQDLANLADKGIFISLSEGQDNSYHSEVTLTGDLRNNFTKIECTELTTSRINELNFTGTPAAFLRVFGPPTLPRNLQGFLKGDKLQLSWSASFVPFSIAITYQGEVIIGNNVEMLIDMNSTSLELEVTAPEGSCLTLVLRVEASHEAGNSDTAELNSVITRPSVPSHTIQLVNARLSFATNLDPNEQCPPMSYALIIQDVSDGSLVIKQTSSTPNFNVSSSNITENTRYVFRLWLFHGNITIETEEQEFLTTDVQEARGCIVDSSLVLITCHFIVGSQSKGCLLQLNISNSIQEHNLTRKSGSVLAEEEISVATEMLEDLTGLVFDLEENGSVGTLPVPLTVIQEKCVSQGGFSRLYVIIIAIIGSLVAVLILALLIIVIAICWKKKKIAIQDL